jgi:hypothetical protein
MTNSSAIDNDAVFTLIVGISIFHGIKSCNLLKTFKRSGKEVRINQGQHCLTPNEDIQQVDRNSNLSQDVQNRAYMTASPAKRCDVHVCLDRGNLK